MAMEPLRNHGSKQIWQIGKLGTVAPISQISIKLGLLQFEI